MKGGYIRRDSSGRFIESLPKPKKPKKTNPPRSKKTYHQTPCKWCGSHYHTSRLCEIPGGL